jgi:hypothetical protein
MWDRSYRWELRARAAAGCVAVATVLAALIGFTLTDTASRIAAAALEIRSEIWPGDDSRIFAMVPAILSARPGNLVHLERADGESQAIGRVVRATASSDGQVRLEIKLVPSAKGLMRGGGVLKGAPPTIGFEQSMRLLVAPDRPGDEVLRARNAIWPVIERNVLPELTRKLVREAKLIAENLDSQDPEGLAKVLHELHDELAPLEEELADRLTNRAWQEIGVTGLAGGVWRVTTTEILNSGKNVRDWLWQQFGGEGKDDRVEREFLSNQRKKALRAAIEDEAAIFWRDHRNDILALLEHALAQRGNYLAKSFRESWGPGLYERAFKPAWLAGEADVIRAVEEYADDFARRRLVTQQGSPRLLFAHALRSALQISKAPLLLLIPSDPTGDGQIVYQPLVP